MITKEYAKALENKNITPSEYRSILVRDIQETIGVYNSLDNLFEKVDEVIISLSAIELQVRVSEMQMRITEVQWRLLKELYELDNGKTE